MDCAESDTTVDVWMSARSTRILAAKRLGAIKPKKARDAPRKGNGHAQHIATADDERFKKGGISDEGSVVAGGDAAKDFRRKQQQTGRREKTQEMAE